MSADSPYATPKSSLTSAGVGEVYSSKRYAVCKADAQWPSKCFKCNSQTHIKKKTKLTYVNPWIYLSLIISPLITIILALIFQKKFTIDLPLCEQHIKKRRNFLIFQWSMVALVVGGIFFGVFVDSQLVLLLALLLFLIIVISAIAGRMVFLAKLKNDNLWIRGAGKQFLDDLPPFQN